MTFLQETPGDKATVLIEQIKTLLDLGLNCTPGALRESQWEMYLYLISDLVNKLDDEISGVHNEMF